RYDGHLVGVGNYNPQSAAEAIGAGRFDLVAIGRPLIANPDYVARLQQGAPLVAYDESMLTRLE
ncbi:MAG: alkene reductase, partial [Aeromonadaceae bacterium]|nr:alkene reductase [Aeromonadaceae bacterium]